MEFYGVKLEWDLRWDWDETWLFGHKNSETRNESINVEDSENLSYDLQLIYIWGFDTNSNGGCRSYILFPIS